MTDYRKRRGYLQELVRTGYPDRPDECWLWPGAKWYNGYGQIGFNGRNQSAHRVSYELHVGPIHDGLRIDHICHERACFNPRHLQPVTNAENLQNRSGLGVNNTSGYRGVYWNKQTSRWEVGVRFDGIKHHGGYFDSIDDAAAAAERLRKELGFRDTTSQSINPTSTEQCQ